MDNSDTKKKLIKLLSSYQECKENNILREEINRLKSEIQNLKTHNEDLKRELEDIKSLIDSVLDTDES